MQGSSTSVVKLSAHGSSASLGSAGQGHICNHHGEAWDHKWLEATDRRSCWLHASEAPYPTKLFNESPRSRVRSGPAGGTAWTAAGGPSGAPLVSRLLACGPATAPGDEAATAGADAATAGADAASAGGALVAFPRPGQGLPGSSPIPTGQSEVWRKRGR